MDAVVILIIALVMFLRLDHIEEKSTASCDDIKHVAELNADDEKRVAKLNESFYEDPNAFTEISTALGFGVR